MCPTKRVSRSPVATSHRYAVLSHDDEVASTTTTRLDPPLEGEEYDDDDKDDSVEDAVLDPEPEGAEDPAAELKRLAEENAELRRQLAASAKGGDA